MAVVFVIDNDPSMRAALEKLVLSIGLNVRLFASPEEFHGDIRTSVRAMKAGAVDFLTKPFRDQELLDAIAQLDAELRKRYATLTARERQIMTFVVIGRANKQISAELNVSEMTVKVHRCQAIRKMRARSLPELVRIADRLAEAGPKVAGELYQPDSAAKPESSAPVSLAADERAQRIA